MHSDIKKVDLWQTLHVDMQQLKPPTRFKTVGVSIFMAFKVLALDELTTVGFPNGLTVELNLMVARLLLTIPLGIWLSFFSTVIFTIHLFDHLNLNDTCQELCCLMQHKYSLYQLQNNWWFSQSKESGLAIVWISYPLSYLTDDWTWSEWWRTGIAHRSRKKSSGTGFEVQIWKWWVNSC